MRHGTKIGIGLVVAVGVVCGVVAMGGRKDKTELASTGGAESSTQAPAPTGSENTGAVASPQPMNVAVEPDRSLRPHVETPAPEGPKEAGPVVPETPAPLPTVTPTPTPAPVTEVAPTPAPVPAPEPIKETSEINELPPIESAAKPEEPKPAPVMNKPQPSTPKVHVVQPGESYSSIAVKYFGSAKYASLIAKANPGKDARRLYVGAKLNLPPAPAGATTTQPAAAANAKTAEATTVKPAAEPKTTKTVKAAPAAEPLAPIPPDRAYKVKGGEHWTDLAQRFLGNSNRWPELYELNKERVAHNPHALKSGTTIELPAGAKVSTRPS